MSVPLFILNVIATVFLFSSLLLAYSIQIACNRDAQNLSGKTDARKFKTLMGHIFPSHTDPYQQKALRKLALVMWGCFLLAVLIYFFALLHMEVSLV